MKFRPEIEGMRAVAVVAVILFHAGFSFVPGGFLGVDIFFVISGFLITSNVLAEFSQGKFSFVGFYRRRVLRLFPASATTVLVTLVVSFFCLPPDEVVNLAKSALSALAAVSNIYFWTQVGYFDTDAHLKPLLHTWSLGVEEQFYLVWPALLLLLMRIGGRRAILLGVLTAGVASLAGASLFIKSDPSAVFYLMPFRIFEFTIGIVVAVAQFPSRGRLFQPGIIGSAGLLAIVFSIVFLDSGWPMPSIYSLVPCLGAAAIIYGGNTQPIAAILSGRVITFIGRISYSLYLVHWPIVIFAAQAGANGLTGKLTILALCFLAAIGQYFFVEQPLRHSKRGIRFMSVRTALSCCAALIVLAASTAVYALTTDGLRFRLPPELRQIPTATQMWEERNRSVRMWKCFLLPSETFADFDKDECLKTITGVKNYLVVGDSLSADLYSTLSQAYPNVSFLQATSGGCTPILGNQRDKNCANLLSFIFNDFILQHKIYGIILGGNWAPADLIGIDKTLAYLRAHVGRVMLAGPPVRFAEPVPSLIFESRMLDVRSVEHFAYSRRYLFDPLNETLIEKYAANMPFINLQEAMCLKGCHLFTESGKLMFIDNFHLTVAGASYLANNMRRLYPNLFQ
jgi:peptidoglycan/LPS O-acetylase OafA/YrhL